MGWRIFPGGAEYRLARMFHETEDFNAKPAKFAKTAKSFG